jgi:hypothetical protein
MYTNAQYITENGVNTIISVEINGVPSFVPLNETNSDYAAIMALIADGKLTIAEAS